MAALDHGGSVRWKTAWPSGCSPSLFWSHLSGITADLAAASADRIVVGANCFHQSSLVKGYDVATGTSLWQQAASDMYRGLSNGPADGGILGRVSNVGGGQVAVGSNPWGPTGLLDAATGRVIRTEETPDHRVLDRSDNIQISFCEDWAKNYGVSSAICAEDLLTGKRLWVTGQMQGLVDRAGNTPAVAWKDHVYVYQPSQITVLDLHTGALIARLPLTLPPGHAGGDTAILAAVADGLLIVDTRRDNLVLCAAS